MKVADRATKQAAPAAPQSIFGSDVSSALSDAVPLSSPKMRLIQGDAVNDLVFQ
jgi:hypothetical protein